MKLYWRVIPSKQEASKWGSLVDNGRQHAGTKIGLGRGQRPGRQRETTGDNTRAEKSALDRTKGQGDNGRQWETTFQSQKIGRQQNQFPTNITRTPSSFASLGTHVKTSQRTNKKST